MFSPSGGFLVGVAADGTGESSWLTGHQDLDRKTTIETWRLLSGTVRLAFGHVLSLQALHQQCLTQQTCSGGEEDHFKFQVLLLLMCRPHQEDQRS